MYLILLSCLLVWGGVGALPHRISGPWYYIADGTSGSFPFNPVPSWLYQAGNTISLSFMNPSELIPKGMDSVPVSFVNATSYFRSQGKTVFYSIGGYGYAGNWNWLSDSSQSAAAGKICAEISKKYSVGIEIDYEGGADPANGLTTFVQSFRAACPVGSCALSMDLYGSPGGQGWQIGVIDKILPKSGTPGQKDGAGNHLDFVNVMVIDGQTVDTAITFWKQWISAKLTVTRATWGIIAGWPGLGICQGDSFASNAINTAWNFLSPLNAYGILSWAVCPPRGSSQESCGDWSHTCNQDAPGFRMLCNKLGSC